MLLSIKQNYKPFSNKKIKIFKKKHVAFHVKHVSLVVNNLFSQSDIINYCNLVL